MTKTLHLIIVIIFSPTYLFSETVIIYATQSAQYSANDCCTLNILTNQNSNSLYSMPCQDMGTYYGCGMSKHVPFWLFDLSTLDSSIDIQSVQFKGNLPAEAWSDVYLSTSTTTGQISTTIASDLWNGGDWASGNGQYSSINWPMGDFSQSLPLEIISEGVISGQLNILTYTSNPWTIFSIDNSGDDAPRLVIEYESIIVAPTGLQYNIQGSSVMLTWDALIDADYYKLERSTDSLFIEGVETSYIQENNYTDDNLQYNLEYFYRVAANIGFWTDYSNVASVIIENVSILGDNDFPIIYKVHQNHPNPFNPVTTLQYDLPEDGLVNITIHDMMGRQIKTLVKGSQTAGYKSTQWNATNDRNEPVSAGLYLYTIEAGDFRQTKKMVLLK
jgi:hypothetical protein